MWNGTIVHLCGCTDIIVHSNLLFLLTGCSPVMIICQFQHGVVEKYALYHVCHSSMQWPSVHAIQTFSATASAVKLKFHRTDTDFRDAPIVHFCKCVHTVQYTYTCTRVYPQRTSSRGKARVGQVRGLCRQAERASAHRSRLTSVHADFRARFLRGSRWRCPCRSCGI